MTRSQSQSHCNVAGTLRVAIRTHVAACCRTLPHVAAWTALVFLWSQVRVRNDITTLIVRCGHVSPTLLCRSRPCCRNTATGYMQRHMGCRCNVPATLLLPVATSLERRTCDRLGTTHVLSQRQEWASTFSPCPDATLQRCEHPKRRHRDVITTCLCL